MYDITRNVYAGPRWMNPTSDLIESDDPTESDEILGNGSTVGSDGKKTIFLFMSK